jgi:chemotaxis protein MotB
MARKRFQEEHENHERWLVSYADFITLLFAFFVVMYAISSVNEGKYRVLSNSLNGAFGSTVNAPPRSGSETQPVVQLQPLPLIRKPGEAYRRDREQLANVTRDMLAALDPLVQEGKVSVMQTAKGVTIDMNAGVLFAVGDATLAPQSAQVLGRLLLCCGLIIIRCRLKGIPTISLFTAQPTHLTGNCPACEPVPLPAC